MARGRSRIPTIAVPEFRSVREDLYDLLRKMIFSGTLPSGARLVEAELARQLGTSRAPLREAVRQLEQDGLLEHNPRRGCVVTTLTREDILDLYSLRALIEGFAIRRVAGRVSPAVLARLEGLIGEMKASAKRGDIASLTEADVRFHDLIVTEAGSKQLHRVWSLLNPQTWTVMSLTRLGGRSPDEIAERHRPVLEALASGDPDRAEAALQRHILELADELAVSLPGAPAAAADRVPDDGRVVGVMAVDQPRGPSE